MSARGWMWVALILGACGSDADPPMDTPDAALDAAVPAMDARPAPMCGVQRCGSPLIGTLCCTTPADVHEGVADGVDRCGADLSQLANALTGQCVELRRGGTPDDVCPPRQVGAQVEPGCCMNSGFCGTLNTAADLGCQRVFSLDAPQACGGAGLDAGDNDAR